MKVGVPGEFHEDRWPRTAEDHREACVSATREAEGAHRIQVIAWRSVLLTGLRPDLRPYSWPLRSGSGSRSALRHGDLACRCLSGIPAWRRGSSGRSSAQRPYPQVPQRDSRVAKESSIGSSARRPYLQVLQGHPRVAKESSIGSSARTPYPQVLQGHPRVAKRVFGTATLPTGTSVTSPRGEEGFWTVFGTVTLPAGASVAYRRGEGVIYRVFGTATLPTGRSVVFSRSHCELVYRIVAILGFVKFTWDEPLLIIK